MHRNQHQSKRQLPSVQAENSVSVLQSGLSDGGAQRHHHGHQHDHLHDQLRRRSVHNESHAAPAQGTSAGTAAANLASSITNATTGGDEEASTTAWTTGGASISGQIIDQTAGPNTSTSLLADNQDPQPSLDRANDKAAAPRVLPAGQSTASQATAEDLGANSTSATATNKNTQSIWQQHFSAAERGLPFGKSRLRLCMGLFNLWAYFFVVYQ